MNSSKPRPSAGSGTQSRQLIVTSTGFGSQEKGWLALNCQKLGAKYSPELQAGYTTHLVCRSMITAVNTPKYMRALQWGVKVVSWQWLTESAAQGHALPAAQFKTDPAMPFPTIPHTIPPQPQRPADPQPSLDFSFPNPAKVHPSAPSLPWPNAGRHLTPVHDQQPTRMAPVFAPLTATGDDTPHPATHALSTPCQGVGTPTLILGPSNDMPVDNDRYDAHNHHHHHHQGAGDIHMSMDDCIIPCKYRTTLIIPGTQLPDDDDDDEDAMTTPQSLDTFLKARQAALTSGSISSISISSDMPQPLPQPSTSITQHPLNLLSHHTSAPTTSLEPTPAPAKPYRSNTDDDVQRSPSLLTPSALRSSSHDDISISSASPQGDLDDDQDEGADEPGSGRRSFSPEDMAISPAPPQARSSTSAALSHIQLERLSIGGKRTGREQAGHTITPSTQLSTANRDESYGRNLASDEAVRTASQHSSGVLYSGFGSSLARVHNDPTQTSTSTIQDGRQGVPCLRAAEAICAYVKQEVMEGDSGCGVVGPVPESTGAGATDEEKVIQPVHGTHSRYDGESERERAHEGSGATWQRIKVKEEPHAGRVNLGLIKELGTAASGSAADVDPVHRPDTTQLTDQGKSSSKAGAPTLSIKHMLSVRDGTVACGDATAGASKAPVQGAPKAPRAFKASASSSVASGGKGGSCLDYLHGQLLPALFSRLCCEASPRGGEDGFLDRSVAVNVIKQLTKMPRVSTAKAAHGLQSSSQAKFCERLDLEVCGERLSLVARDKSKAVTLPVFKRIKDIQGRPVQGGDQQWVIADPLTFYCINDGDWWMEYFELLTGTEAVRRAEEVGKTCTLPSDIQEDRELLRDVCCQHIKLSHVMGVVCVTRSKRIKSPPTSMSVDDIADKSLILILQAISGIQLQQRYEYDSEEGQVVTKEPSANTYVLDH